MIGLKKRNMIYFCLRTALTAISVAGLATGALAATKPQIDGKLGAGEYQRRYVHDASKIELNWSVVGDTIYFGIKSPSLGWTGIGFSPDGPKKKGTDLIMWSIDDGKLAMADQYASTSPIPKADTAQGGKDDILQKAGVESKDGTVVEFSRKLVTGDKFDDDIVKGTMQVLLALTDVDTLTKGHKPTQRWSINLDLL